MGRLKDFFKTKSIKKSFTMMVLIMAIAVTLISIITIGICLKVKAWLVPITDEVMLNVYTETENGRSESAMRMRANGEKFDFPVILVGDDNNAFKPYNPQATQFAIEPIASPEFLSPKKTLLYNAMSWCMIAMPIIYAISGIIICSIVFYKKKLALPLDVLSDGAKKIADNDLDFTIDFEQSDELGKLCVSFEKMRLALLDSQRTIWKVMEERKNLNASVAHDLRTPITIIMGYTEYLERNMKNDKVSEEKLLEIISNLSDSAIRLEHYVNSVRDIQSLEDLETQKTECIITDVVKDVIESFTLLAENDGKTLVITNNLPKNLSGMLDKQLFYRLLENIISNALRFAKQNIEIAFTCETEKLIIIVNDDGDGFSEKTLQSNLTPFYKKENNENRMALGLSICNILCRKHGGNFSIDNNQQGGAKVVCELLIN